MLSQDEANTNVRAENGSGTSDTAEMHVEKEDQGIFKGDFDMEHNVDDDDDDDCPILLIPLLVVVGGQAPVLYPWLGLPTPQCLLHLHHS